MQETADQYRQRMFSYLNGRDPVKMQAAAPAKLEKLLKGISPGRAGKRPAPGKWSVAEIVAHTSSNQRERQRYRLRRRFRPQPGWGDRGNL